MCYSALLEQDLKKYQRLFGVKLDRQTFREIFTRRASGEKIEIPRAFETNFSPPHSAVDEEIERLIRAFREKQMAELETKYFEQKKKHNEAGRKLSLKPTKTAENARATAERQMERIRARMDRRKGPFTEADSRIFAFQWAPLVLSEKGEKNIELQRYHLRPFGMKEDFDRKYPGCYNARRDSLTGFWRKEFGRKHGLS